MGLISTQVEKKLLDITDQLPFQLQRGDNQKSYSLLGGKFGITLFLGNLQLFETRKKVEEIFDELLSDCIYKISSTLPPTLVFSSGLAGYLLTLKNMQKQGIIDIDLSDIENHFREPMLKEMVSLFESGNFDFLHGALGISLNYCNDTEFIRHTVKCLEDTAIRESGMLKWETAFNIQNKSEVNISLSHGMSSIITVLTRLYGGAEKPRKVQNLIEGAVAYILSQEIDREKYGCMFPSASLENDTEIHKTRLSWCYGDLGIALCLWQAGKKLGNEKWKTKSLEIFSFNATRILKGDTLLNEAGICHGFGGVAMIYRYMYIQTEEELFREMYERCIDSTLEAAVFDDGIAGYKSFNYSEEGSSWNRDTSFLEGVSGIGLALLSYLQPEVYPEWLELLLMFRD